VPLVFTVRAGETADLVHALLELTAPPPASQAQGLGLQGRIAAWSGGGLALAALAGWAWLRRARAPKGARA
jgi:hypothetical protein